VSRQVRTRWGVLYVPVKPSQHFVDEFLVGFKGGVPMWFVWQHDEACDSAVAADGFIELRRLEGRGAGVCVLCPVHDE
jgi:hypothetical protein